MDETRLLSVVPSDRTRSNRHKPEPSRFRLKMRRNFFDVMVLDLWRKLPREVAESAFLERFQTQLDMVILGNLLWVTFL